MRWPKDTDRTHVETSHPEPCSARLPVEGHGSAGHSAAEESPHQSLGITGGLGKVSLVSEDISAQWERLLHATDEELGLLGQRAGGTMDRQGPHAAHHDLLPFLLPQVPENLL